MGQSKYVYTFVPSGEQPDIMKRNGMKRANCVDNARLIASRDGHSQDVFRRALEDAEGHRVLESDEAGWQFVSTVGKKKEQTHVSKEEAVLREVIRVVEQAMPIAESVQGNRVMHFRRDGMREAVTAIKKHWRLN